MQLRPELKNLKRLVVKVGSNVVTRENGSYDSRRMRILVEDICELRQAGVEVLLVSSGAVNAGKAFIDEKTFQSGSIESRQAASSIGQPRLLQKYCELFNENEKICSQVLLTHEDFKCSKRYQNAKNTIEVLFQNNVTPILNENDTVSFVEIAFGDNDQLAAQAAVMLDADALLIVTSTDGVYDKNPRHCDAKLIKKIVPGQDLSHFDMSEVSSVGTGGMKSKVQAIQKANSAGIIGLVSSKSESRIVLDALQSEVGTLFCVGQEVPFVV
ncbi:MAG: glutamate 5-kinase [Bacteriovoracaceae bacterium]|nr:glutamate 5-kinase [Bacteriovoracaceae bacterium]